MDNGSGGEGRPIVGVGDAIETGDVVIKFERALAYVSIIGGRSLLLTSRGCLVGYTRSGPRVKPNADRYWKKKLKKERKKERKKDIKKEIVLAAVCSEVCRLGIC